MKEHFDDPYVKEAQKKGYRSRACFKLIEIQEKDKLIQKGMRVVDLGAAPGGWSQLAAQWLGDSGKLIASDILPMDFLPGVEFIQGDFSSEGVYEALCQSLGGQKLDLVICDMAPNITGMRSVDQPRSMYLAELALDLARKVLTSGGSFVTKVFQGEGFEELVQECRQSFKVVRICKPAASRQESRETYIVASGFRL